MAVTTDLLGRDQWPTVVEPILATLDPLHTRVIGLFDDDGCLIGHAAFWTTVRFDGFHVDPSYRKDTTATQVLMKACAERAIALTGGGVTSTPNAEARRWIGRGRPVWYEAADWDLPTAYRAIFHEDL